MQTGLSQECLLGALIDGNTSQYREAFSVVFLLTTRHDDTRLVERAGACVVCAVCVLDLLCIITCVSARRLRAFV